MHLDGQFTINAARPEVYAFLTDPSRVRRVVLSSGKVHYDHMPDVKNVVIDDEDHFAVTARVGVSHIKGDVVMKLTITDRQPPVSTTIVGKGTGLASVVDMVTSFTLASAENGETVVNWQGDVTISGKLAAFGPQGLMDRIARKNIDTFIEGIRNGLTGRS